jgi:hypothetical protein
MKTQDRLFYEAPGARLFLLGPDSIICGSGQVRFSGNKGYAGYVDNDQNYDGGDF